MSGLWNVSSQMESLAKYLKIFIWFQSAILRRIGKLITQTQDPALKQKKKEEFLTIAKIIPSLQLSLESSQKAAIFFSHFLFSCIFVASYRQNWPKHYWAWYRYKVEVNHIKCNILDSSATLGRPEDYFVIYFLNKQAINIYFQQFIIN